MPDENRDHEAGLVLHGGSALATQSADLARRGLELLRHPLWESFDIGEQDFILASVSPTGLVANVADPAHTCDHAVIITSPYGAAPARLSALGTDDPPHAEDPYCFAWSPDSRYLLTGSGDHLTGSQNLERALRLFDLATSEFVGVVGRHPDNLFNLAWSGPGQYLASSSSRYLPMLKLWRVGGWPPIGGVAVITVDEVALVSEFLAGSPAQAFDPTMREWRGLDGFHSIEFSPTGEYLAAAGTLRGEGGDFLTILHVPSLRELIRIPVGGRWTLLPRQLSWRPDFLDDNGLGCLVYATSEGRTWEACFNGGEYEVKELPVTAQMCACNPYAPICAFALYGPISEAKLKPQVVSIYSFHKEQVVDAYEAPNGVADLRWNMQGSELYVLQTRGPLLVYRPDLEAERRRPRQWVVRHLRTLAKGRLP